MPRFEFEIETTDGLTLRGQGWEPDGHIKAVVCLVHGIGEHSGRYVHVAEAFNREGFALIAVDLRGHGKSEGMRGHSPSYDLLLSDLFQGLEKAKQRYPQCPHFLYGHSLGGNLVIHYALRKRSDLAGVIASAPLLRLAYTPPAWKTTLLRVMYALRITHPIPRGVNPKALSHDETIVHAYQNDPLTHQKITAQLAIDMLKNGEWNLAHAAEFPLPLLLLHGTGDRITSAQATREFAARAKESCTLKTWDGLFHQLHNEPEKSDVLATIINWMNTQIHKGMS